MYELKIPVIIISCSIKNILEKVLRVHNCYYDNIEIYSNYYDYSEQVKKIKPHRVLALNRGEKEGVLSVSIDNDDDRTIEFLCNREIKKKVESQNDGIKFEAIRVYKRR